MEHTKEPWRADTYEYSPGGDYNSDIFDGDGLSIICGSSGLIKAENARRIIACVNACAGIPTENIENITLVSGSIKGRMLEQVEYLNCIEKQRDELLQALKFAVEDEPNACFADNARAVISRVEGE